MKSYKVQWCVVMATVGLIASHAAMAEETAHPGIKPIEELPAASQEKKERLKFRRGPTCMCAHGTSEEEIRQAEEKRRSAEREEDH